MPGSASPPGSYATAPPTPDAWVRAAYADQPLITRVGALHADHATSDDRPTGLPTSSAIAPGVIVRMLRHARLTDDADVLQVGAGPATAPRSCASGPATARSPPSRPTST